MPINIPDLKNKILSYVTLNGPCLPVQLSKQIHSNILFAGAVLSELVANQKLKISHSKVGGSPVYYIQGQESKLSMLYPHLHEREKKAYDLLKENKVLHDKSLEPWQRVALRELNDFAYPIKINEEIYWRWYSISEDESNKLIQEKFNNKIEIKEDPKLELTQENKPQALVEIKQEQPQIIKKEQVKIEPQIPMQLEQKKLEIIKEELEIKEEKPKKIKKIKKDSHEFYSNLNQYLKRKKIEKLQEDIIKKDKDFEIIANIPSSLGLVRFLIIVRDKKKISDADLSLAHNKAQLRKLPLLYLSNGELMKQAKEYMQKNYLIFEKI